ncbi:uncharacterized protein LOC125503895, partial [Dendroctonus ponderosae]|uniref:uncharacterized protein LOC125503895 n=1 Tax=Dendroctonus ponderosae TaxID=77166 RepID=UPI002035655F
MDFGIEKLSTVQGRDTPVPVGISGAVAGHPRPSSSDCDKPSPSVVPRADGTSGKTTGKNTKEDKAVAKKVAAKIDADLMDPPQRQASSRRSNSVGDVRFFPQISIQGRRNFGIIDLIWDDKGETSLQMISSPDRGSISGTISREKEVNDGSKPDKKRKRLDDTICERAVVELQEEAREIDLEGRLLKNCLRAFS